MSYYSDGDPLLVRIIFYGIYHLLLWPGIALFLYRRKIEPIKSRGVTLAVLQCVMTLVPLTLSLLDDEANCTIRVMAVLIIIPFTCTSYYIRGIVLYHHTILHAGLKRELKGTISRRLTAMQVEEGAGLQAQAGGSLKRSGSWRTYMFDQMVKRRYLLEDKVMVSVYLIVIVAAIAIAVMMAYIDPPFITDPEVRDDFSQYVWNRCFTKHTIAVVLLQFCLTCTMISVAILLLLRAKENYLMRLELFLVLSVGGSLFFIWLSSALTPVFPEIINDDFWGYPILILFEIFTLYMPIIASYKYEKAIEEEKEHLTHNQERRKSLVDEELLLYVLEDETLRQSFQKYVIQSWCTENLIFYLRVQTYKNLSEPKLLEEAKNIWENHFESGAASEINVDSAIKEKIMETIQVGSVDHELFHAAEKMIFEMLRFSILPMWKTTAEYRQLLKKYQVNDLGTLRQKQREALN